MEVVQRDEFLVLRVVGDCENRTAHSHNRHHELSLGLGGVGAVFSYGDSMQGVWGRDDDFGALRHG